MKNMLIFVSFFMAVNSYALDFYKAKNTFENSKKTYSKDSDAIAYGDASRFPASMNIISKKTTTK